MSRAPIAARGGVRAAFGDAVRDALVRRDGPRTRQLARVRTGRDDDGMSFGELPAHLVPDTTMRSVCGFCATGCSLTVHVRGGDAVNVTPTPGYPVNDGSACPKGWEALAPVRASDRLTAPLLRNARGRLEPVSWDTAAQAFTERMRAVAAAHGNEALAYLSTGQITTEEMALLGAFAKFGMGIVDGDANTRQCMATSVVAHKEAFGFDAPPYTYDDLEHSDVIVLVGSNLCIAHPILWERVTRNPHRPAVVAIDPRHTETAAAATMHLAVRPGHDLALLLALGHELARIGAVDTEFVAEHTVGFDEWKTLCDAWPPSVAAPVCGVAAYEICELASVIARGERVSFWWTMGVNQGHQAVRTAQAVINLALMTGSIGRPGTGANSITGQCNAMGSRLFSNTASLYGGRDFADATHRTEVAALLGIDEAWVPRRATRPYHAILDAVDAGSVRALWVVATNTAHSWFDRTRTEALLDRLDFLVVQDLYADTATARHAHLVLPAAGWAEKDGTMINSERRVGAVRAARRPPGDARTDFDIVHTLARAWGCGEWLDRWATPALAFERLKELSAGRPCDITGIRDHAHVETTGGIQWPYPADGADPGAQRRLFTDGAFFHPDRRARFVVEAPQEPPELPDAAHPLVLLTGRRGVAEWHTGTRSGRAPVLRALAGHADLLQLHPDDAAARGIVDGTQVRVSSRRGEVHLTARLTPTLSPGQVFAAMHDASTNTLVARTVDPHSGQPAYKQSCVQVSRA